MNAASEPQLSSASDPLADLRVLQIGDRLAGRLLSRLMSDQGARVQVVDPRDPASADSARQLLAGTAVVIDAAADGVAEANGLGFGALRAARPGLIYCSLPLYPLGGPAVPDGADEDVVVAAEVGLNFVAGRPPRVEELPVGSAFAAFMAAGDVLAALLRPSAAAQRIVVPLTAATLTTVARRLIRADDPSLADPVAGPRLPIAARYECADGRFIQSGGAYPRFVETLVEVIGHPEWRQAALDALVGLPTSNEETMWRVRLAEAFAQRDAAEWERDINAAGGSCTMCRTRQEWLAEPYAEQSQIVDGGRRAGRAVRVFEGVSARGVAAARDGAADVVPADTGQAPLHGVTVLDLSIVLAGPTCGRTLSDLGADVIKVDDPHRPISPYGWLEVNRGKRSMVLDLRQEAGRAVLWRLIGRSDVVVENYRHGKLSQLGFGFEAVARARPGIVYASLNAFDVGGSWAERAGWEHNAQAATGMQLAQPGWGPGSPPDQVTYPLNDFGTGLLGAYGILLALRQRERTGRSQFVAGSLARTSTFIQSPLFEDGADGRPVARLRWVACADGYLGLLADPGDAADFGNLATLTREQGAAELRARGLDCVEVRSSAELADRSWLRRAGLLVDWEHPRWGMLHQALVRSENSRYQAPPSYPARDPGQDAAELLAEHGYTEPEISALFDAGAVASVPLFEMWSLA